MKCDEARELITALVDEELTRTERSTIEAHLDDCPRCKWAYRHERALKNEIHRIGLSISAPAELKRKIFSRQDVMRAEAKVGDGWTKLARICRPMMRPAFALVLLVLILLPMLYLLRPHGQPISLAALEMQQKIVSGEIRLRRAASQIELREWQSRAVDGKFAPMAYDLSAINLRPIGGAVQEIDRRKVLITVYGGNHVQVTCFTFLGTEKDAPKNAKLLFFDGIEKTTFYTFSSGGVNAVLHRKGDVICLLVSRLSMEQLLDIATTKVESS